MKSKNNMFKDRIGEINYNKWGERMTIIQYKNNKDIKVKFDNGYIHDATYQTFIQGNVSNPYTKSLYNIGYVGEGLYKTSKKGIPNKIYSHWHNMFARCYNEKQRYNNIVYKDCIVSEEWHNFQNFAKWFDDNYYEVEDDLMCLDKDILIKGNKTYSPENCIFVPKRINSLFIKSKNNRGTCPIGVHYDKRISKYRSQCNMLHNNEKTTKKLGLYDSPKEAFNAYKEFKEFYIKQVAEEYKDKIPNKLYDAMYKHIVEITD